MNADEDGANDVSRVVHEYSTTAANRQLLAALRNQRDVVMDGTMTWLPFVAQTIAMIRQIHCREFELGPGWGQGSVWVNGFALGRYDAPLDPPPPPRAPPSMRSHSRRAMQPAPLGASRRCSGAAWAGCFTSRWIGLSGSGCEPPTARSFPSARTDRARAERMPKP